MTVLKLSLSSYMVGLWVLMSSPKLPELMGVVDAGFWALHGAIRSQIGAISHEGYDLAKVDIAEWWNSSVGVF